MGLGDTLDPGASGPTKIAMKLGRQLKRVPAEPQLERVLADAGGDNQKLFERVGNVFSQLLLAAST